MLLQGNTSQVRNVQQDMMKIKVNMGLTEQESRKIGKRQIKGNKKGNKKAIENYVNQKYAVT